MSLWLMALHLFNFLAPAIALALMLGLLDAFLNRNRNRTQYLYGVIAMYFMTSLAVLVLGLALLGRDGKVLTYTALVVVSGGLAAWRHR